MKRFFIWKKTAGAVVFHFSAGGKIEYLILRHKRYWNFPKGGVEKGETELAAARREIAEETSLSEIAFIPGFRVRKNLLYRGTQNSRKVEQRGRLVFKPMVFFLARAKSKKVKISHEHLGFAWLDFAQAERRLSKAGNSYGILVKADKFLREYLAGKKNS